MKRITKISLVLVSTLTVAGLFSACNHRGDPEQRAQRMMDRAAQKLELDDTQQAQLQNVSVELMNARKAMKQEFGKDREQMWAMLEEPTMDQDRILTVIRSHTDALNEQAPIVIAAVAEFYDGLTAEQQAQIREFVQERRDRHGDRHH
ncbi:MAG: Spy/CpxP family protein refolding chaperone [Halioglobus sp.]